MTAASFSPLEVCYCSDPADFAFCQSLDLHLAPLKRNGRIQTWNGQQILPGQDWKQEYEQHLSTAPLLLLLISPDFLASEMGQYQMNTALCRHQSRDAVVIPILVRPCGWQETELSFLQILPREQKALSSWPDLDEAWQEIVADISCVIETIRKWVFVAYASEDRDFVMRLYQDMASSNITFWSLERKNISSDLGQDTDTRDAMRNASVVVLIASPAASSSRTVKAQMDLAADYRRPITVVWVRGEDWKGSNPGNWHVEEVLDARAERYEMARETLLARLKQHVAILPSSLEHFQPRAEPRNPYKGLQTFTAKDTRDFFGREALMKELATALENILVQEKKGNQHARLLAVLGASGSGKSSVVMAGLLPSLQQGEVSDSQEWIYLDPIVPGTYPLETLAISLAQQPSLNDVVSLHEALTSDSLRTLHLFARQLMPSSQRKVVLIIDQFEEIFTLTTSEEERQHFFDLLVTAVTEPQGPLLVILTLRADFYDRPMQYPALYRLLDAHRISVLPMEREDLRRVIEQPALLPDVQLTFEGDLVGDLLFEMREQVGALPLLQFTLDQLFAHRSDHQLTLQAYREIGGVKGALSQYAETVYQDMLKEEQCTWARNVFLRLIEPGSSELDTTRRRANRSEFILPDPLQTQQMQETLEVFIKARLLTIHQIGGNTTIEVSHEALIREWRRLADWMREAREDIILQQTISEDATEWIRRAKPIDRLYRGTQLAEAQEWVTRNMTSRDEAAFLQSGEAERQRQEAKEQSRQRQELTLKRQTVNRLRSLVAVLSIFLVVVVIFAYVTETGLQLNVHLRQQDDKDRTNALDQLQLASSRALSANAGYALTQNKLAAALLLSAKASQVANTYEARNSLLNSLEQDPQIVTMLHGTTSGEGDTLQFSSDGRFLVASSSTGIDIWNTKTGTHRSLWMVQHAYFDDKGMVGITGAALSPDDRTLVTAGGAGVMLWDMQTGRKRAQLDYDIAPADNTHTLAERQHVIFSRDGTLVASDPCNTYAPDFSGNCATTRIFIWKASSRQRIGLPLIVHSNVNSIAFSPNGHTLASVSDTGMQLWDVATSQPIGIPFIDKTGVQSVAFSPDGKTLAFGGGDALVKLWDVALGHISVILPAGHTAPITSIAFSPDGKTLVSGSEDKTVRLWDVSKRVAAHTPLQSDVAVNSVAFSPDGRTLASAGTFGATILWNIEVERIFSQNFRYSSRLFSVVYSLDGKVLFIGSEDGKIFLRDAKTMNLLATLDTVDYPARMTNQSGQDNVLSIQSLALSADGGTLASGRQDGTIILWDVKTEKPLAQFVQPPPLEKVLLSANGQTLAASGGGEVTVWSVAKATVIRSFHPFNILPPAPMALSPDGKLLAIPDCGKVVNGGCNEAQILLWDVGTGHRISQPLPEHHINVDEDVAFSPDGHILASSIGDSIRLWDVTTQKPIGQTLPTIEGPYPDYYSHLVFSSNRKLLLAYNPYGEVFGLWDVAQHKPFVHSIHVNRRGVQGAAFSPDGRQMASVSFSGTITLWDISIDSWQDHACSIANRNLSEDEWRQFIGDDPYTKVCRQLPVDQSVISEQSQAAQVAAQAGHMKEAASDYRQLTKEVVESQYAADNYTVCRDGSLDHFAQVVLSACEHAVALEPDNGTYRDSRGIARALTGDAGGAIEDFRFFVRWATEQYVNAIDVDATFQSIYQKKVNERNGWIGELEGKNNPFDAKTLEELKNEYSDVF